MNSIRTLWCFTLMTPMRILTSSYKVRGFALDSRETTAFPTTLSGPPWRILFLGSDDFSVKHLERLCSSYNAGLLISNLSVCTTKDSIVARLARFENLALYKWPLKAEDIANKFDLGVVVSFGHLIPEDIIYAMPLFDTGDIVHQYKCAIDPNETTLELIARFAEYGAGLLMGCFRDLPESLRRACPQDESEASYAPHVKSTTSHVAWDVMTARDVYNLQRALGHMYPLQTKFREMVVRLYSVTIMKDRPEIINTAPDTIDHSTSAPHATEKSRLKSAGLFLDSQTEPPGVTRGPTGGGLDTRPTQFRRNNLEPGRIIYGKGMSHLLIICRDKHLISVKQLCVVGRKPCSAVDFYNGYLSYVPKEDWMFY